MGIHHPPCTPESACSPYRCHPALPPCLYPEKCLKQFKKKGVKPCPSAVSLMAEKELFRGKRDEKKSMKAVNKWLKQKQAQMKKQEKAADKKAKERKKKPRLVGPQKCCKPAARKQKVVLGKEHKEGKGCTIL